MSTQHIARNRILIGDAASRMRDLPTASIDCIITSPPYFRLRNYQHDGQIGLERHVDEWVDSVREVLRESARLLKPTGSLWINLGDTYARSSVDGALPKSLVLAPERIAHALLADDWIIRNKVIWSKPNPMPTSVRDRLSCTYEVVYFATRSEQYFFDLDAIRSPHSSGKARWAAGARVHSWAVPPEWRGPLSGQNGGLDRLKASGVPGHPLGKNPGDVWSIATAGYRGSHHAVYPTKLLDRPLQATCPERVCETCGVPWTRERFRQLGHVAVAGKVLQRCACPHGRTEPGLVLDPFMGSGTTAIAAEKLGRDWLGVELNRQFARTAIQRIRRARQGSDDLKRAAA